MRYRRFAIEGLDVFKPTVLNLAEVAGSVIAVAAPNGFGKSTLLSAMGPGILFRELPTRDPPVLTPCHLTAEFTCNGHEYISELDIRKNRQTATLLRNGAPMSSGKVADYDRAVREELKVSRELFYATAFTIQGRVVGAGANRVGTLHLLERRDRRSIFRNLHGLDRYQAISEAARGRAGALVGVEAEQQDRAERLSVARTTIGELTGQLAEARLACSAVERRFRDAEAEVHRLVELRSSAFLFEQLDAATDELDDVRRAIKASDKPTRVLEAVEQVRTAAREELVGFQKKRSDAERVERELDAARGKLEQSKGDAAALERVPCRGEGKFGGCSLIARAVQARDRCPALHAEVERLAGSSTISADAVREHIGDCEAALRDLDDEREHVRNYQRLVDDERRVRCRVVDLAKKVPERDEVDGLPTEGDVETARRRLRQVETEWCSAQERVVRLSTQLESSNRLVSDLKAAVAKAEAGLADYAPLRLIERAFAPDGIQALEIEVARPRLEELANQLLASCYEDRFRLELRTQREKVDGGLAEDFDVVVFDNRRGGYTSLRGISGGEGAVASEAMAIAICIFNAERNNLAVKTLWRDECTDMLDAENAARYVEMLRSALRIGGFEHVFFSTHVEHCVDAADVVFRVNHGTVEVVR